MSKPNNIELIRKLFDIYNVNDLNKLDEFDEFLAPNIKFHDPSVTNGQSLGLQAFKEAEADYVKGFPDKLTKIDGIFEAEDQVVVRWTVEGNYEGPFHGFAPNHKQFKVSGISIYRIANNKVIEVWQIWDRFALLDQIGEIRMVHAV
jgi:steroid delta-isomerase-like uncharacterized protein